jgi:hypothetical protein
MASIFEVFFLPIDPDVTLLGDFPRGRGGIRYTALIETGVVSLTKGVPVFAARTTT